MKKKIQPLLFILLAAIAGAITIPPTFAGIKALQTIDVVVGDCRCGNRMASFDSVYKGKNIEVGLYYGGDTKIFKGKREIKGWQDVFCPKPGTDKGPLRGKMVTVTGRWTSPNSFGANRLDFKP